jgi:hypothetical protein
MAGNSDAGKDLNPEKTCIATTMNYKTVNVTNMFSTAQHA